MNEPRHVAAEARDFTHQARAQVGEVERRHEEHRLDARSEVPVHERHLKLVLEVAHRPQAPDDERRARRAGEVGEQAAERADLDTRVLHACRMRATRSSSVNRGCLPTFTATATITRSLKARARRMRSSWPRVIGSKEPG